MICLRRRRRSALRLSGGVVIEVAAAPDSGTPSPIAPGVSVVVILGPQAPNRIRPAKLLRSRRYRNPASARQRAADHGRDDCLKLLIDRALLRLGDLAFEIELGGGHALADVGLETSAAQRLVGSVED